MNIAAINDAPPLEAVQALAQHLRENPEAAGRPFAELADAFDLQPEFVDQVLRSIHRPKESAAHPNHEASSARNVWRGLSLFADGFAKYSTILVGVTTTLLFVLLSVAISPQLSANNPDPIFPVWGLPAFLGLMAIHCACYYRASRIQAALHGSLVFWIVASSVNVTLLWITAKDRTDSQLVSTAFVLIALMLLFASLYASAACFAAVLGGYVRIRLKDRAEDEMSRQELLERLFEVRAKLKDSKSTHEEHRRFIPEGFSRAFRRSPYFVGIGTSAALSLCTIILYHFAGVDFTPTKTPALVAMLLQVGLLLSLFILIVAIGYLSGSFRRGLVVNFASSAVGTAMSLIPLSPFGPEAFQRSTGTYPLMFKAVLLLALTAIGALGASVEKRSNEAQRLKDNDAAALLAEMVRLEWRLNLHSTDVCVVVVDASKSAEMKSKCDPLAAEYSFREYQNFLASICRSHGGTVHSTAGDGAVLAFPRCEEAFAASQEIQTSISYFNEHVNKIPARFHLRIGMHTGHVSDDLSNIQFTNVIDIAAHVEAVAPVRGILMTRAVADLLPGVQLLPLKDPVDGHEVLLAYNPTADA